MHDKGEKIDHQVISNVATTLKSHGYTVMGENANITIDEVSTIIICNSINTVILSTILFK